MKIIAFYLPQFHEIPENNDWWGEGFTEWTNVKNAYPLYEGHDQPKIPLNHNYYNLLDNDVKKWQSKIAKEYGVYGFCYYHYWFNGHMLLEKPMEQMLNDKEIDTPFCICWANEPWTKIWSGNDRKVLIPQKYGEEKEWKEHFDYLLPFFKDERYICKDGKPIVVFYRPKVISCIKEMIAYWKKLAVEAGLPGLAVMSATNNQYIQDDESYQDFDNIIEWQPHTAKSLKNPTPDETDTKLSSLKKLRRNAWAKIEQVTGVDPYKYDPIALRHQKNTSILDYDEVWKKVIQMKPLSSNSIPGAFVRWDNTARYKDKATIIKGETPEKFKNYLCQQIEHAKKEYKSDMLFMYAWNEWAEGGFLEPDEVNKYAYLQAIKDALIETNEFPELEGDK